MEVHREKKYGEKTTPKETPVMIEHPPLPQVQRDRQTNGNDWKRNPRSTRKVKREIRRIRDIGGKR